MGLETILVGVDFSTTSEQTCQHALAIARHAGARLVLAHATALPEQPEGLPPSMQDTAAAFLSILRGRAAEAQRDLAELGDRLTGQGAEISQLLIDGFADDALVHTAAELHADLVVTGSHGRRGVGRVLLGSVAERVVRGAACPVLVARGEPTPYRTVCVATDFTEAAEHGIDLAIAIAAPDATIDILHFWDAPPVPRGHATDEVDETVAEIRAGMIVHGEERGAQMIEARGGDRGGRLRYHLREGDPTDGITHWAAEARCDLVVVGGHGRRGLRRLLLGSVAEATVRQAPCSVLVAR